MLIDTTIHAAEPERVVRFLALLWGTEAMPVPGGPHRFQNCSATPARMVVAMTPGGFEGYFREVGVPVEAGATPPPLTPALIDRLLAPAQRYGLRFMQA